MFIYKPKGKSKEIDPRMIYKVEERFKPNYKPDPIPKYYIDILPDDLQSLFSENKNIV
tara:strand:+ start:111 stop:284 length:174 start_codon:yes stop_codon:yes gene_type:complete